MNAKDERYLAKWIGRRLCMSCDKPLGNGPRYIITGMHFHVNCYQRATGEVTMTKKKAKAKPSSEQPTQAAQLAVVKTAVRQQPPATTPPAPHGEGWHGTSKIPSTAATAETTDTGKASEGPGGGTGG